jgi:hypothetical protein
MALSSKPHTPVLGRPRRSGRLLQRRARWRLARHQLARCQHRCRTLGLQPPTRM